MKLALALAPLAFLVACGDDGGGESPPRQFNFDEAAESDIAMFIAIASGTHIEDAHRDIRRYAQPSNPPDPCPAQAVAGSVVTLTGGCTTQNGITIAGTATLTNPISWTGVEYDGNQNEIYAFTDYVETTEIAGERRLDGQIVFGQNNNPADADLVTGIGEVDARTDLVIACGAAGCDFSGTAEIVGVGMATVMGQRPTGSVETMLNLRGADTLEVTLGFGAGGPCAEWRVVETGRMSPSCQ